VSKSKSVYFIKIYRRVDKRNVSLDCEFGAFSSPKKAIEWLINNKDMAIREFAQGHNRKNLFFAIMQYEVDSPGNEWCGIAILAVDLSGVKIEFFN
jgi:hypothetical protein